MRQATDLKNYQIDIIKAIRSKQQLCVFSKPGSGKTAAVLYGVKSLAPSRTLIIAPKFVCQTVWAQEAAKWEGLKHLTFTLLCQQRVKRNRLMREQTDFHLLNYELVRNFNQDVRDKNVRLNQMYDCIIFDEVSYLKDPGTKRFRSLRSPILDIPIRIGMTGTPVGNSYLNLWGEMFMCAGKEVLGPTYTEYKKKYFSSDFKGWKWELNPGSEELIKQHIDPHSITVKPPVSIPREFIPVNYSLPAKLQPVYQELVEEFVVEIEKEDGKMLVGGQAAVVKNKLRQFESGAIYYTQGLLGDNGEGWLLLHKEKIERLVNLVDSVQGAQFVIVYNYRHELERIMDTNLDVAWVKEDRALERWLSGEVQCLAIHPASAGHGLNLHTAGCHNMAFFTLPWSYELFEQTMGRLTRIGQKNTVNVYHFAGPPVENQVFFALRQHRAVEESFLNRNTPTQGLTAKVGAK